MCGGGQVDDATILYEFCTDEDIRDQDMMEILGSMFGEDCDCSLSAFIMTI